MKIWPWVAAGALIGAVPATVMEFAQPAWQPLVLTAFALPMCAGALLGLLCWMASDRIRTR